MILRRFRDVAAALRDPSYRIAGGSVDEPAHREMREQARELYSPANIWFPPPPEPEPEFELIENFAEPWSLALAAQLTGMNPKRARDFLPAAQIIFDSAGSPDLQLDAAQATRALAAEFPRAQAALHVQAFVALAVSLPAFIGNAALALLQAQDSFAHITERTAVDELLRFAGPSLKQTRIRSGEFVELRLAEANRDPDQFPDPDLLDLCRRNASTHLAFGGGSHACAGAPLIKAAANAILPILGERLRDARLLQSEPYGGPAIRGHRVWLHAPSK